MTRAEAEAIAALRMEPGRHRVAGITYKAERSLTGESEWAVVTYQNGKPYLREYSK